MATTQIAIPQSLLKAGQGASDGGETSLSKGDERDEKRDGTHVKISRTQKGWVHADDMVSAESRGVYIHPWSNRSLGCI